MADLTAPATPAKIENTGVLGGKCIKFSKETFLGRTRIKVSLEMRFFISNLIH